MPLGIRRAQVSMALPKIRNRTPRAFRCAAMDSPKGPAPMMATSHFSASCILDFSSVTRGLRTVPPGGQDQAESVEQRRIAARDVEMELAAIARGRLAPPILGKQRHAHVP